MPLMPSAARTVNHTAMTGPNTRPTAPVPSRWAMNRPTMITTVMGMTRPDTDGAATLTPSTAESTEMAGVIMLSPKNSEAPKIPRAGQHRLRPASAGQRPPADQGDQRHDPALAVVVGPHHEQDVGDGDDDRHRPEDQRDDPEDAVVRHLDRMRIARIEKRLHRVQRARPDVPEDDPESAERESPCAAPASVHAQSIRPPPSASTRHPNEPSARGGGRRTCGPGRRRTRPGFLRGWTSARWPDRPQSASR